MALLTRKAPEHARLHFYHSWMLRSAGKHDAAVRAARRAVELDPHSLTNVHALNWALFMAGQVDEALESEREIAAREPWVDVSHTYVAVFASMLGLHEEAIQAGRKALEVSRGNPTFSSPLPFAMARAGETEEATRVIETLLSHKPERMVSTHGAAVFAAIGDLDRTAEWLEIARRELCPWFDSVQHDPRFAACLGDSRIREVIQDVADAEMLGVYADNSESTQRTAASG